MSPRHPGCGQKHEAGIFTALRELRKGKGDRL